MQGRLWPLRDLAVHALRCALATCRRPQLACLPVLAALAGCAASTDSGALNAKAGLSARAPDPQVVPAGAVALGGDLDHIPVGSDADGCLMYRLYSPGRMVPLAIAYRAQDGGFTMDQSRAMCDPELVRRR